MDKLSMADWLNERQSKPDSGHAQWFLAFEGEIRAEFPEPLRLPRAWWSMLSIAYLAGCGVGEAAALLCKMLGTVYYCPQLRMTDSQAEEELVRCRDHIATVQECARNAAAMVESMEEFHLTNDGWKKVKGGPDLPIA